MKGLQNTICLDGLRSSLVSLYSLIVSEAERASSLNGSARPQTI